MGHLRSFVRAAATVLAALLLVAVHDVAPAAAATLTVEGTLDDSDPSATVAKIITPACTGELGEVQVHYDVISILPQVTGPHTIALARGAPHQFPSIYVIEGAADPQNFADRCIAASSDTTGDTKVLTLELTAGQRYDLVVFDDTSAQVGADYVLTVEAEVAPLLALTDMGVQLADDPAGPLAPGDAVTLTATVSNGGLLDGEAAQVVLTLPPALDPGSVTDLTGTEGYDCADGGDGTVTCTVDVHAAGTTATISLRATVAADAAPGTHTVTAEVRVATPEADPSDDVATLDLTVQLPPAPPAPPAPQAPAPAPAAPVRALPRFTG